MIHYNKVTWYSKLTAVILFIFILPAWTFFVGVLYELTVQEIAQEHNQIAIIPTKVNDSGVAVDSDMLGKYFEPHGAAHYIILNADGTFVHNRIDEKGEAKLVSGKFTLSAKGISFIYNDKYPTLNLQISHPDYNWYLMGDVANVRYYFVKA